MFATYRRRTGRNDVSDQSSKDCRVKKYCQIDSRLVPQSSSSSHDRRIVRRSKREKLTRSG